MPAPLYCLFSLAARKNWISNFVEIKVANKPQNKAEMGKQFATYFFQRFLMILAALSLFIKKWHIKIINISHWRFNITRANSINLNAKLRQITTNFQHKL